MQFGDTIAALSSGGGPAARAIVRLSGPTAVELGESLCDPGRLEHLAALRTRVRVGGCRVPAWVYCFRGPASYTGEDVVELHLPGNVLIERAVLDELLRRGARQAEAGEFTARAYFNGRMDLTEAEGVAAIVGAHGERELAAARQLMAGELARRLKPIMDQVGEALALVEVGIDFSEEDVTFLSAEQLCRRVDEADGALERLVNESARFERLSHEPRIALAGRPNAGKSTLLNALAGIERAVVSPVAGTTRDVIWAEAALERGMVRIVDAAGLEAPPFPPAEEDSSGQARIAQRMHEQSVRAMESADRVVLVHDATDERPMFDLPRRPDLVVLSKSDLTSRRAKEAHLAVSAMTGEGMHELRRGLDELAFGQGDGGSALALNQRHLRAIDDARAALGRARKEAEAGAELIALELREALDALGRILGAVTPEDVLSRVFATFCIGK